MPLDGRELSEAELDFLRHENELDYKLKATRATARWGFAKDLKLPLSVASKEVVAYAKARVTLIERGYRICCKACCSRCPAEIRCRQGSM